MRAWMHRFLKAAWLGALLLPAIAGPARAGPTLVLAAAERHPYLGDGLPDGGYVQQVVTEAFRRSGWSVEIRFFPRARALAIARNGGVDGLVPAYALAEREPQFLLSAPFPGDRVGLLKRKDRALGALPAGKPRPAELLAALKAYRFGVVRGAATARLLEAGPRLETEAATSDAENLNKLFKGRIDLAVIDKYTAADLMVSRFPHMIGQLQFLPGLLAETDFHVAFSRAGGRAGPLKAAFDRGLQALRESGRLQAILTEHGLRNRQPGQSGKHTLRIGAVANPHLLTLQRASHLFEQAHPEIRLEWVMLDEPILRLRTLSDLALADGKFDVMTIGPYEARNWARQGWLAPVAALPKAYAVDDLLPPIRAALSYGDRLYSLPLYAETSVTYYRRDLFQRAGLQMPDTPSYAQIRDFAARLHAPERGVYGICLRGSPGWGANMAYVNTLVNSFGGRWFDPDWTPTLDSPAWREALTFYRDLLGRYGPPRPERLDYNRILGLFQGGHCAQWIDASSFVDALLDPHRSSVSAQVGMAGAPVARTARGASWLWAWGLAIPVSSREQAAAQRFIAWATSPAYIAAVAQREGWLAVPPGTRRSTYGAPYRQALPFAERIYAAIRQTDPDHPTLLPVPYRSIQYVDIPEYTALGDQVGEQVARLLAGALTVDQAIGRSQRLVAQQMRESGYPPGPSEAEPTQPPDPQADGAEREHGRPQ